MASKIIKPKLKKCKVCPNKFEVWSSTQVVCSPQCAVQYNKDKARIKADKEHNQRKKEHKANDRSFQLKKTQTLFNRFIRLRDNDLPCISCSRFHDGQYHAGHFRSVGGSPELRFNEDNCHRQCAPCNNHLSGNIGNYRIGLVHKMGVERVERLEGPHEPKRYTLEDLKELQEQFKAKIKELEK